MWPGVYAWTGLTLACSQREKVGALQLHLSCMHTYIHTYNIHTYIPTVLPSRSFTTSFVIPSFSDPATTFETHIGRSWLVGLSGPLIDSHGFSIMNSHGFHADSPQSGMISRSYPINCHKPIGFTSLWIYSYYGLAMFSPWFTSDPTVYLLELVDFCWFYSTMSLLPGQASSCLPGAVSEGQAAMEHPPFIDDIPSYQFPCFFVPPASHVLLHYVHWLVVWNMNFIFHIFP